MLVDIPKDITAQKCEFTPLAQLPEPEPESEPEPELEVPLLQATRLSDIAAARANARAFFI